MFIPISKIQDKQLFLNFIKICVGVPNFFSIARRNIGHTICSFLECVSTTRLLFQVRAQVTDIGERWPRNRLHKLAAFNTAIDSSALQRNTMYPIVDPARRRESRIAKRAWCTLCRCVVDTHTRTYLHTGISSC